MDLVNSYALRLANVTRRTPDPADGRIERDPDGEPNGLLRAKAKILVRGLVPRPTLSQLLEAVRLGCHEFNRFGITSVLDPGLYPWEMHVYQAAYEVGLLSVRMNVMPSRHGFRGGAGLGARLRSVRAGNSHRARRRVAAPCRAA